VGSARSASQRARTAALAASLPGPSGARRPLAPATARGHQGAGNGPGLGGAIAREVVDEVVAHRHHA
jgi:hypothetical protein